MYSIMYCRPSTNSIVDSEYPKFILAKLVQFLNTVTQQLDKGDTKSTTLTRFATGIPNPSGPGSVVGIATGYGLDGPGIESRWGRDFPHLSTQPHVQWAPGLSQGVKSGRGLALIPHPLLVPWSKKSRAIPLLPLWAVRPVQSLNACTSVHFTLQQSYTSTPPMGRMACTEPQCLYKGALYLFLPVLIPVSSHRAWGLWAWGLWASFLTGERRREIIN